MGKTGAVNVVSLIEFCHGWRPSYSYSILFDLHMVSLWHTKHFSLTCYLFLLPVEEKNVWASHRGYFVVGFDDQQEQNSPTQSLAK